MPNRKKSVLDGAKLNNERLVKLYHKLMEIEKKINEGAISFSEALDVLQNIVIEGKSSHHLSVISGELEIKHVEHLIDTYAVPFIPKSWLIEKHSGHRLWKWNPNSIQLFLSKEQKINYEVGFSLQQTIENQKGKIILNANVLDYLLANPELIPESWKGKSIFFWGTIYRRFSRFYVRCLRWGDDGWLWGYRRLGLRFYANCQAALASS